MNEVVDIHQCYYNINSLDKGIHEDITDKISGLFRL